MRLSYPKGVYHHGPVLLDAKYQRREIFHEDGRQRYVTIQVYSVSYVLFSCLPFHNICGFDVPLLLDHRCCPSSANSVQYCIPYGNTSYNVCARRLK